MNQEPITPRLLTVKQAAVYLGRSQNAVYKLIYSKILPTVNIGGRRQLDVRRLDKLIADNTR